MLKRLIQEVEAPVAAPASVRRRTAMDSHEESGNSRTEKVGIDLWLKLETVPNAKDSHSHLAPQEPKIPTAKAVHPSTQKMKVRNPAPTPFALLKLASTAPQSHKRPP